MFVFGFGWLGLRQVAIKQTTNDMLVFSLTQLSPSLSSIFNGYLSLYTKGKIMSVYFNVGEWALVVFSLCINSSRLKGRLKVHFMYLNRIREVVEKAICSC